MLKNLSGFDLFSLYMHCKTCSSYSKVGVILYVNKFCLYFSTTAMRLFELMLLALKSRKHPKMSVSGRNLNY